MDESLESSFITLYFFSVSCLQRFSYGGNYEMHGLGMGWDVSVMFLASEYVCPLREMPEGMLLRWMVMGTCAHVL